MTKDKLLERVIYYSVRILIVLSILAFVLNWTIHLKAVLPPLAALTAIAHFGGFRSDTSS